MPAPLLRLLLLGCWGASAAAAANGARCAAESSSGSCEDCRAAGCGWCAGECVPDAPGHCGVGDVQLVGFAGPGWMCKRELDQEALPESSLQECLMMGQLAGGGMPLGASAARIGSAGWLLLRKEKKCARRRPPARHLQCYPLPPCRRAAGAHVTPLVPPSGRKMWCEVDDSALACRRAPAAPAIAKSIDLAHCTSVAPGSSKGELLLTCSPAGGPAPRQHRLMPPTPVERKLWAKSLMAVALARCRSATPTFGTPRFSATYLPPRPLIPLPFCKMCRMTSDSSPRQVVFANTCEAGLSGAG